MWPLLLLAVSLPSATWRDNFSGPTGTALTGQSYLGAGSWTNVGGHLRTTAINEKWGGDIGSTDLSLGVSIPVNPILNPGAQIFTRYVDASNHILGRVQGGNIFTFFKVIGGVLTGIGSSLSATDGDRYELVVTGSSFTAYRNGVFGFTYTIVDSVLLTGTQFYLGHGAGAGTIEFDNLVIYGPIARPATWYVAPAGQAPPYGDGSLANPWDWSSAFTASALLVGDDHIQARCGGTSEYGSTLLTPQPSPSPWQLSPTIKGSSGHPIVVERYPPDVDVPNRFPHVHIQHNTTQSANDIDFYDIDFGGNDPTRYTTYGIVSPPYPITFSFSIHTPRLRLINCAVHDFAADCIGLWEDAGGAEVYGSYLYNAGFMDTTRHSGNVPELGLRAGNTFYTQNDSGIAHRVIDNVGWYPWLELTQIYSAASGTLSDYLYQGNTFFYGAQGLIAGGAGIAIKNVTFDQNVIVQTITGACLLMGYLANAAQFAGSNCIVTNNYLRCSNGTPFIVQYLGAATVTGNRIISTGDQIDIVVPTYASLVVEFAYDATQGNPVGTWDNNAYVTPANHPSAFRKEQTNPVVTTNYATVAAWSAATGFDASSTLVAPPAPGPFVQVRPNTIRPNTTNVPRAHITICDSGASTVLVDVSTCLQPGDTYALWHVFNWVANYNADGTVQAPKAPDQTGVYGGGSIPIVVATTTPPPIVSNGTGQAHYPDGSSDAVFGITPPAGSPSVYVLVQTGVDPNYGIPINNGLTNMPRWRTAHGARRLR